MYSSSKMINTKTNMDDFHTYKETMKWSPF